jgi:stringent starvation protein B
MSTPEPTDTKPYLIRALHEWCTDNGFTPHVAVRVDPSVRVPTEYVKDGEIVLNVSYDATSSLQIGNDFLEFKARFGGIPREIMVPISRVLAIYARENGQGMAFGAPAEGVGIAPPDELSLETSPIIDPDALSRDSKPHATLTAVADRSGPPEAQSGGTDGIGPGPAGGGSRPALKRIK